MAGSFCRPTLGVEAVDDSIGAKIKAPSSACVARLYFEISPALSIRGSRIFARAEQDPGVG